MECSGPQSNEWCSYQEGNLDTDTEANREKAM